MRNKMASRVATRYMQKQALFGKILDFFNEPEREQAKRPVFDEVTVWLNSDPRFGIQGDNLKYRLKMKGNDNAIVLEHEGEKIKLSVGRSAYQQGEERNMLNDGYVTLSATGVDSNVSKSVLRRVLESALKDARVKPRIVSFDEPKGRKYL